MIFNFNVNESFSCSAGIKEEQGIAATETPTVTQQEYARVSGS